MTGIIDWFAGGINFKEDTNIYKVGDIRYPAHNGTNGWFTSPRWELVMKVKNGKPIDTRYIYDIAAVDAITLIQELNKIKKGKSK